MALAIKIPDIRDASNYPISVLYFRNEIAPQDLKYGFLIFDSVHAFEILVCELQENSCGCFRAKPVCKVRDVDKRLPRCIK